MKNNYILIDYENVQPKNLAVLNGHPIKVIVFVGANQAKVPFDLATSLQALGSNAEYVRHHFALPLSNALCARLSRMA